MRLMTLLLALVLPSAAVADTITGPTPTNHWCPQNVGQPGQEGGLQFWANQEATLDSFEVHCPAGESRDVHLYDRLYPNTPLQTITVTGCNGENGPPIAANPGWPISPGIDYWIGYETHVMTVFNTVGPAHDCYAEPGFPRAGSEITISASWLHLQAWTNTWVAFQSLTTSPAVDADGDGFFSYEECDDTNADIHPGAPELCDGLDNDCDGLLGGDVDSSWVNTGGTTSSVTNTTVNVDYATQGTIFEATQDVFVNDVTIQVRDNGGSSSANLEVYESAGGDGPWTLFSSYGVPSFSNTLGYVERTVDFGGGLSLTAGNRYAFFVQSFFGSPEMTARHTCSIPPEDPPWGLTIGSSGSGGPSDVIPADGQPGASCVLPDFEFAVTLPLDESDTDGDGSPACADCGPDDGDTYPGAPEICDGVDNDCDGIAQVSDVDSYDNSVGGNNLTTLHDGQAWGTYGPTYHATSDTEVLSVEFRVFDILNAGASASFSIYESAGGTGPWTEVANQAVPSFAGETSYVDRTVTFAAPVPIDAGDRYTFVVHPNGASWVSVEHHDNTGSPADNPSWGAALGRTAFQARNWNVSEHNNGQFQGPLTLMMDWTINTGGFLEETDGDGDQSPVCADCDDTDATIYPGAPELCDALDNDCDEVVPADEADGDGDFVLECDDCDDADATNYPGNVEVCDGFDEDCDGVADNGFIDTNSDGEMDCVDDDDDGDGMPDTWEIDHGLDPLVDDSTGDPDGDGISNLDEYLGNTDPNVDDSTPVDVWGAPYLDADLPLSDASGTGLVTYPEFPVITHNPTDDEYLVLWSADDTDAGVAFGHYEVFGQRVNSAGAQVGENDFRISFTHDDADGSVARFPRAAWNSTANEFLVGWSASAEPGGSEMEVFVRRVAADGTLLGAQTQISTCAVVSGGHSCADVSLAYNAADDQYLAVYVGNPSPMASENIFGVVLDADATVVTPQFQINTPPPSNDADAPDVAWNATDGQYLVAWEQDVSFTSTEFQILARRLHPDGSFLGGEVQVTGTGPSAGIAVASEVDIAWSPTSGLYMLAYNRQLLINKIQIGGQRMDPTGALVGDPLLLASHGLDSSPDGDTYDPNLAWNPTSDTFLLVYTGDDHDLSAWETYFQEVPADGTEPGNPVGERATQVRTLGNPFGFSLSPGVAYSPVAETALIVSLGDPGPPLLAAGEREVFGGTRGDAPDTDGDGVPDTIDCDETDPNVSQFEDEDCTDGIDNDCDGDIDSADDDCATGDDDDATGDDDDSSVGDDDDSSVSDDDDSSATDDDDSSATDDDDSSAADDDDSSAADDDDSADDDDATGDDDDTVIIGDDDDSSDDDDSADDDDSSDDDDSTVADDDDTVDDDDDATELYEGDEPGECSDGADNDQDGLFDCDDEGCEGSPDCQDGDDDDAVGDDDDSGGELQGSGCEKPDCSVGGGGSWLAALLLLGLRRRRN